MTEKFKAILMFSGGLDSILAARIIRDEGFEVVALHFYTGFNGAVSGEITRGASWKWTPGQRIIDSAEKLGIQLVPMDVSDEYLDLIINPRYGHGSGVNPCIDCRIFLLKKAKEVMETKGAVMVFTGEVLGQRPMSQMKGTLRLVEKQSSMKGKLLRPLSAKLLDPTIPELEGIVNRGHLYDISGRSRKPQMELAKKFGIDWYPSSTGGCLLTDRSFRKKFHDLVSHSNGREITLWELNTLKTGRHFRLESGVKVIVGRNMLENQYLFDLLDNTCWYFDACDFKGAMVFALDEPGEEDFLTISAITARYSKGIHETSVAVTAARGDTTRHFTVKPAEHSSIEPLMIC
ncbi:thiamine biosynthesis protein [Candidatus Latescibacterota bacterium]